MTARSLQLYPERPFLEKVFLIHELFSNIGHAKRADRKSRHLYDLSLMMDKEFAKAAVNDDSLWETIRHHREVFTSISGIDYTPDVRKRLMLIPPAEVRQEWESDYQAMCQSMIFGNKPTFSQLLERMKELENRFHQPQL